VFLLIVPLFVWDQAVKYLFKRYLTYLYILKPFSVVFFLIIIKIALLHYIFL